MKKCPICEGKMLFFDKAKILEKYDVNYWRCSSCGCIQTDTPYWLEESYSSAITDSDIGLPMRNYAMAERTAGIIGMCMSNTKTYLDFGGGYGLFVRLMRDKGFCFEWYDKYCINLFAKHFCKNRAYYDLVTAYEVLEHLTNPVVDIEEMLSYSDNLLFSTCLIPDNIYKISDWDYFSPNHGQHVFFYTREALSVLAGKFDRQYVGYGDMHMFTKAKCSYFRFRLGCRFFRLIGKVKRRNSLLMSDYNMIVNNVIE